jgi:hypothetical protein
VTTIQEPTTFVSAPGLDPPQSSGDRFNVFSALSYLKPGGLLNRRFLFGLPARGLPNRIIHQPGYHSRFNCEMGKKRIAEYTTENDEGH